MLRFCGVARRTAESATAHPARRAPDGTGGRGDTGGDRRRPDETGRALLGVPTRRVARGVPDPGSRGPAPPRRGRADQVRGAPGISDPVAAVRRYRRHLRGPPGAGTTRGAPGGVDGGPPADRAPCAPNAHSCSTPRAPAARTRSCSTTCGLHDLILEGAGNQRSRSIVRGLRETTRLLGASTADRTRTIADIDREHTPIVDCDHRRTPCRRRGRDAQLIWSPRAVCW